MAWVKTLRGSAPATIGVCTVSGDYLHSLSEVAHVFCAKRVAILSVVLCARTAAVHMAQHAWTPRSEPDVLSVGFAAPVTPPQSGSINIDHQLFDTPADLRCPITLTIFKDPVINSAGHTYDRHAIEAFFANSRDGDIDPLSRTPLPTRTLTPVHVLRSRALEYRQRTANTCVEVRTGRHPPTYPSPPASLHQRMQRPCPLRASCV